MSKFPSDEQAERIFRGELVGDDPLAVEVARVVASIRVLGDEPIAHDVASVHIAMAAAEAAISAGTWQGTARVSGRPTFTRRRFAVTKFLTGAMARVLAVVVALAAVGTGVAVAADGSGPGHLLHGLDLAMERVGIADGGASERLDEAFALASSDLPAAVAAAAVAAETAGSEEAAAALNDAAERIHSIPEDVLAESIPDEVAALLAFIREQLEREDEHGVVGAEVAALAKLIGRPDGTPPSTPVGTPPAGTPPVDAPPVGTPPVDAPPVGTPPVDAPPVGTPPVVVPTP